MGGVHQILDGFFSNLFLVPKKDGGQRPVINLKALNGFVRPEHFKMEGIPTLKDTGDWMAKVDLKDTYFTIPIHSNQRKYLRFVVTYKFNCLPFGLSSAPWVIIYQDPQTSGSTATGGRSTHDHLRTMGHYIPRPSNQWQHCYGRQDYKYGSTTQYLDSINDWAGMLLENFFHLSLHKHRRMNSNHS